jgi:AraC-like DNA-binding protein
MKSEIHRRIVRFGTERMAFNKEMRRHQHSHAYATVVLAGEFEQFSYAGRLKLEAGDVLINPTLDSHSNRMHSRGGVTLIRLPWRHDDTFGGVYRNLSIDIIERLAGRDSAQATGLLEEQLAGKGPTFFPPRDWPDKLAIDLGANPWLRIAQWAANHGVTREYAWRSFYRSFGVAPAQFRSAMNTRAALLALVRSNEPLSKVAADCGFSDQSHMARAIKLLTGKSPARCRSSHLFSDSMTGQFEGAKGASRVCRVSCGLRGPRYIQNTFDHALQRNKDALNAKSSDKRQCRGA